MIHPLKFIVNFKEVLLLDQLTSCAVVLTILNDNELAIDEALARKRLVCRYRVYASGSYLLSRSRDSLS